MQAQQTTDIANRGSIEDSLHSHSQVNPPQDAGIRANFARHTRDREHPNSLSNTRSRSTTPWYLSHCLFLGILMIRLLRHNSRNAVPWWLTFSPILLSSATVLLVKSCEAYLVFKNVNNSPQVLSFRVYCALVDHVGYTATIVMTCVYLSTTSLIPSVGIMCAPLIMTSTMSLVHRLINLPPLQSRTIGRLFVSSIFNCVIHTLMRIIQPMLLVIKLDDMADISWKLVILPLWLLCSGAVVASISLIYFSTFLHAHANPVLRIHAAKLMLLCAAQLLVLAVCSFLSSFWLSSALDANREIAQETCLKVFLPLVAMSISVAILYPLILSKSSRYHELLFTSTRMYMAMQSARRLALNPLECSTWLIQESNSLFRLTSLPALKIDAPTEQKLRNNLRKFVAEEVLVKGDMNDDYMEKKMKTSNEECRVEKSTTSSGLDYAGVELKENPAPHLPCIERKTSGPPRLDSGTHRDITKVGDEEVDERLSLSSSSTLSLVDFIIEKQIGLVEGTSDCGAGIVKTDDHMCIICYDSPADSCFMECGHGNTCYECALEVAKKAPAHCPICRVAIGKVLRIGHYVDPGALKNIMSEVVGHEESDVEAGKCITRREDEGSGDETRGSGEYDSVREGERLVLSESGVYLESTPYHPSHTQSPPNVASE